MRSIFHFIKPYPLVALAVTVILVVCIAVGWNNGKQKAFAEVVVANSQQVARALGFFFQDNDRYPTGNETRSGAVLGQYLSRLPFEDVPVKGCEQSYYYRRDAAAAYTLQQCLPASASGYPAGWSEINK